MKKKRPSELETLLTEPELAQHLKVSEIWIRKARKDMGFPFLKIGSSVRFSPSEVKDWIDKSRKIKHG